MSTSTTASLEPSRPRTPSSAPDWQTIAHDVTCPMCDYNLRGLSEPVCPECGYRFAWPDVCDPARRLHPYLFEHHPERNIRSFLQTLIHHLRAVRFWRTMNPSQPSRAGRIVLYWAIYSLAVLVPPVFAGVASYRIQSQNYLRTRYIVWNQTAGPAVTSPTTGVTSYLVRARPWVRLSDPFVRAMLVVVAAWAAYPWLSFLALLVFQQSMRRVRVKTAHVLRCALYGGDVIFWFALWADATILLYMLRGHLQADGMILFMLIIGGLAAILTYVLRLTFAYRLYMQFDRAVATILASQLIVVLTVTAILAYLPQ